MDSTEHATKEYLLAGGRLTCLEATALHGCVHLASLVHSLRGAGVIVKSRLVTYAAVVERLRKNGATLVPPLNLPIRDITFTEYWISR